MSDQQKVLLMIGSSGKTQGGAPIVDEAATGNESVKPKRSLRFKIGVFFFLVNTPIGYGGGALAAAIGVKTGQPLLGAGVGAGIYVLSWCMLGLGVLMAGPEGVQIAKDLRQKLKKKSTGTTRSDTRAL